MTKQYKTIYATPYEVSLSNVNRMKSARNWHTLDYFQHLTNKLFFEDLDTNSSVQFSKEILHEMISGFYSEKKPVIFSWYSPFPDDKCYVYVNAVEYVAVFIKMRKALLVIKDNLSLECHEKAKTARNEFYDHVATLKNLLRNQVEIYDKAKLEKVCKVEVYEDKA
ncbi:hypothetical protein BD560DRAFT_439322 [Blakeslea trispora]|nr:hypothetical protein BD560DRAFT_439322 [Blakeslea trispora]